MLKYVPLELKKSSSAEYEALSLNRFLTKLLKQLSLLDNDIDKRSAIAKNAESAALLYSESEIEIIKDEIYNSHNIKRDFLTNVFNKERLRAKENHAALPAIVFIEKWLCENYDIRFNTIANIIEYRKKIDVDLDYIEFNEHNILREAKHCNVDISRAELISIVKSDFTPKHNPIKEYFKTSEWDGHDHIGDLSTYIKVYDHDRERFNKHFRMMFIRTIAGAIGESYNKRCLVFVGGQDAGKTWFCNWLCPPALKDFKSDEIDFNSKDGMISLGSNFWIILDELAHLSKAGINTVKSVLSKNNIKVRLPYDPRESMLKRRCSFIANTNDLQFLTDPTGSVRWICFKLKGRGFDREYSKKIDINQVWAQAYDLFLSEERYDMNQFDLEENNTANHQFTEMTIEQELILQLLRPANDKDPDLEFMNAEDIIVYITSKVEKLTLSSVSIGKALRKLNFQREQIYNSDKGYSTYGYNVKKVT